MRTTAENFTPDLAHRRAVEDVSRALRDLTSNLMRVARGAGKPHDIHRQTQALIEAFAAYREATGAVVPSEDLAAILSVERDSQMICHVSGLALERLYAEQAVVRSALQIAASRLVDQKTQETVGQQEMYAGIRAIGEIHGELLSARDPSPLDRENAGLVTQPRKPKSRT